MEGVFEFLGLHFLRGLGLCGFILVFQCAVPVRKIAVCDRASRSRILVCKGVRAGSCANHRAGRIAVCDRAVCICGRSVCSGKGRHRCKGARYVAGRVAVFDIQPPKAACKAAGICTAGDIPRGIAVADDRLGILFAVSLADQAADIGAAVIIRLYIQCNISMAVGDLCRSSQLADQTADGAFSGRFGDSAGDAAFVNIPAIQSAHKTADPVGRRPAAVRRTHRQAQIYHVTVLNRSAGRAGERARQADHITGNVLCRAANCDTVQIQVAELAARHAKQAKHIGFQRSAFRSDGDVGDGMSFAVKISGKHGIVCASKQCIRKGIPDRRPVMVAKINVCGQNKTGVFIRLPLVDLACQICKLCAVGDLIGVALRAGAACKSSGDAAVPCAVRRQRHRGQQRQEQRQCQKDTQ